MVSPVCCLLMRRLGQRSGCAAHRLDRRLAVSSCCKGVARPPRRHLVAIRLRTQGIRDGIALHIVVSANRAAGSLLAESNEKVVTIDNPETDQSRPREPSSHIKAASVGPSASLPKSPKLTITNRLSQRAQSPQIRKPGRTPLRSMVKRNGRRLPPMARRRHTRPSSPENQPMELSSSTTTIRTPNCLPSMRSGASGRAGGPEAFTLLPCAFL